MPTVRLSLKNQIVLPKEARDAMKLKGRNELLVVVKGGVTVIMPKPESYRSAISVPVKSSMARPILKRNEDLGSAGVAQSFLRKAPLRFFRYQYIHLFC